MLKELFRTKSVDQLSGEAESGNKLKRALGPIDVTALGIGGIIGAGIFATIGTAAAGDPTRPGAGPALILSFVVTAIACGFAALCYAEFAAMIPISGSAYTYAYGTLGELVAWIIGWDLIIEYAVGNVGVFQLGQPRILFAMARDGLLPPVFARVHPYFRTPLFSTVLTGVFVATVSAFANIEEMVDLTNIGTLFAFILVCVGIIVLRVKDPARPRPFRVPGGLLVPVLGIVSCLYLI